MRARFITADVFTDRVFGGNPLCVFPDGRGLTTEQMQLVAREINYSESVFVLPPDDPAYTRRLRIFTPALEMPFAGHPTVGTAFVLATMGEVRLKGESTRVIFEEGVGPVPVTIRAEHNWPVFTELSAARMPEFGPPPPSIAALAEMLSLQPADLLGAGDAGDGNLRPEAVSCGVPFLFVPVRNLDAIARARLRLDVWERVLQGYWASQPFVFTDEVVEPGSAVHARMFAPTLGVGEDPATGAAATALAGYLGARDAHADGTLRWRVEQGYEMGRPSMLHVEADKRSGEISAIRVGGQSVLVSEGTMDIP